MENRKEGWDNSSTEKRDNRPLAELFPMIRTRKEVLDEIRKYPALNDMFQQWNEEAQEEFLEICTGGKGMKVLYDGI